MNVDVVSGLSSTCENSAMINVYPELDVVLWISSALEEKHKSERKRANDNCSTDSVALRSHQKIKI